MDDPADRVLSQQERARIFLEVTPPIYRQEFLNAIIAEATERFELSMPESGVWHDGIYNQGYDAAAEEVRAEVEAEFSEYLSPDYVSDLRSDLEREAAQALEDAKDELAAAFAEERRQLEERIESLEAIIANAEDTPE